MVRYRRFMFSIIYTQSGIMNSPEDNSQFERQRPVYLEINFQIICAVVLIAVIGVSSVTFFGLGQTLGPLLMGYAFGFGGISSVFYAATGFAVLIFFVFRYCTCM